MWHVLAQALKPAADNTDDGRAAEGESQLREAMPQQDAELEQARAALKPRVARSELTIDGTRGRTTSFAPFRAGR